MGGKVTGNIDWDGMYEKLQFTNSEKAELGFTVVDAITQGIINQITYKGEALSLNSVRRLAMKLRLGKPPFSLIFTGKLKEPNTYDVKVGKETVTIKLEDGYAPVHLNLILVSGSTGKNYQDFFGISKKTKERILTQAFQILLEKVARINLG